MNKELAAIRQRPGFYLGGSDLLFTRLTPRVVYGPDYIAHGYVSADWHTAKLMIPLMWLGTLLVSALALLACYRRFAR